MDDLCNLLQYLTVRKLPLAAKISSYHSARNVGCPRGSCRKNRIHAVRLTLDNDYNTERNYRIFFTSNGEKWFCIFGATTPRFVSEG